MNHNGRNKTLRIYTNGDESYGQLYDPHDTITGKKIVETTGKSKWGQETVSEFQQRILVQSDV